MSQSIVLIHGMFQNAKSWEHWIPFLEYRGFEATAISWPLHEGAPKKLRQNPPDDLGDLRLQTVIDRFAGYIRSLPEKPVVIGHSVGGLIVQKFIEMEIVKAAVAISSVAPNRMLAFDWGFFRNSVEITNPFLGDRIFEMSAEGFHKNFANTMSENDSNTAYETYATHDSRNVLRDCMLSTGQIDLSRGTAPILFLAADQDEIIPPHLCEKNSHAHANAGRTSGYECFANRGHFICGEPGWEDVAGYAADWITSISAKDDSLESAQALS